MQFLKKNWKSLCLRSLFSSIIFWISWSIIPWCLLFSFRISESNTAQNLFSFSEFSFSEILKKKNTVNLRSSKVGWCRMLLKVDRIYFSKYENYGINRKEIFSMCFIISWSLVTKSVRLCRSFIRYLKAEINSKIFFYKLLSDLFL